VSKCLEDIIEKVQKGAFRIIYPATGYEDALNIAQYKRLDDRRQELCAKTLKIFKNLILILIIFYP
jgi:hypothetical protein